MHEGIGHLRAQFRLRRARRGRGALTLREPNCVKPTLELSDVGQLLSDSANLLVHVAKLRYAFEVRRRRGSNYTYEACPFILLQTLIQVDRVDEDARMHLLDQRHELEHPW